MLSRELSHVERLIDEEEAGKGWGRERPDEPARTPVNIVTRAQINGPVLHTPEKANELVSSRYHAMLKSNQNTVGRIALLFGAIESCESVSFESS